MGRSLIAVTFDTGGEERGMLLKTFSEEADLTFLAKMNEQDRKEALSTAEVLLAWNPPRELKKEEYQLLHRLRFIQLVSAGADHLPFSDIPPQVKIASNVGAYAEPMADVTAKSRHPLEEGDPAFFNYLKRMDSCLRGNDTQVLLRLFAVASWQSISWQ